MIQTTRYYSETVHPCTRMYHHVQPCTVMYNHVPPRTRLYMLVHAGTWLYVTVRDGTLLYMLVHVTEGFHTKILLFLCGVQYVPFGTKTIDAWMEVTTEYASISCMYYISCTCYLQVSLFLLYVWIKADEFLLFCVLSTFGMSWFRITAWA